MNKTFSAQLNTAVNASLLAGKSIMRFYSRLDSLKITSKGFNDYVSEADQESEKIITDELSKKYPNYKITAEESGSNKVNSEFEWFIDPLDGTTNFIHGIPQFAISIGLCKNKVPILGVVYDPFKNELFCAEEGNGAYLNNKRIRVSNCHKIKSAVFGTGIPYRKKDTSGVYIETLRALMDARCGSIRRLGAAALDLAYVSCGRLDGYFHNKINVWDVAAGVLIIREAGGKVNDINEFDMNSINIRASNNNIYNKMLENLKNF